MDKAINLQAKLNVGSDANAATTLQQSLPARFAADNPGLKMTVKHVSPPDDKGDVTVRIYIEGDQEPAADFAALTRGALHKTIASMNATSSEGAGPDTEKMVSGAVTPQSAVHIKGVQETEGDDEDTGVTLAPSLRAQAATSAPQTTPLPALAPPQPTPPAAAPAPQSQQAAPVPAPGSSPWWAFWKRGN